MRIGIDNLDSVLRGSPERLHIILPEVFEKLLEPDQDKILLQNYCGAFKKIFEEDVRPPGQVKFDSFEKAAFEAGIVKNMLTITQNTRPEKECSIAAYQALDSISHLIRTGNIAERGEVLDQLIEFDAVNICLDKAMNHPLAIHRSVAVNALRVYASECFLGDRLTSEETSKIMSKMCQFILAGPESSVESFGSPETTWQSCMALGSQTTPASIAAKYAPRYYAMAQESAIWVASGLLCRWPPPTKQFCLDIIKHDPELLDLLFECAIVKRPAWYPETQVDSVACEVIATLFQVPLDIVPGVSGSITPGKSEAEWKALLEALEILTSRKNWVEKIVKVWAKIDDEKWQSIKPLFHKVKSDYYAQSVPDEQSFREMFEYRGASRICMLRIIASLTHVSNIPEPDLTSLLRIGYLASQNIKSMQASLHDEGDRYKWIERAEEIFRTPMHALSTGETSLAPTQIAGEVVAGPLALIRLLTVLAERGVLESIRTWTKLPAGTSTSTSIGQIKQITDPDIIRRVLVLAMKRTVARREKGHERLQSSNEEEFALEAYRSAAELAAALVAFNRATDGKWEGQVKDARKELVLCLGNAAEMALRIKIYAQAYNFATGAMAALDGLGTADKKSLEAKNLKRLQAAKAGLAR